MTHNLIDHDIQNRRDLHARIDLEAAAVGVQLAPVIGSRRHIRRMWDWLDNMRMAITQSVGEAVTTVITLGLLAALYVQISPSLASWATFTTASLYAVLLLLRIVRRANDACTNSEIMDYIATMDSLINEKLDMVVRNV